QAFQTGQFSSLAVWRSAKTPCEPDCLVRSVDCALVLASAGRHHRVRFPHCCTPMESSRLTIFSDCRDYSLAGVAGDARSWHPAILRLALESYSPLLLACARSGSTFRSLLHY